MEVKNESKHLPAENVENARGHNYDEVLDIIGFGRAQKKVLIACALLILTCMNELMGINVISIVAHCELKMNNRRKGIVLASALWGKLLTSFFWGHLSDQFGRRTVLICATFLSALFSVASMMMPNFWSFVYFRFFVGMCIGGTVSISLTYLGEFLTPNQRPFLINYVNISNGVSYVYTAVVAYVVLEMDWTLHLHVNYVFRPWRLLILCNILPAFIALILLFQLPESPKFLLALGERKAAIEATEWICQQNNEGRHLQDFQIHQLTDDVTQIKTKTNIICKICQRFDDTCELFQMPHIWNFLICCAILTGAYSINCGMGLWYPIIQNDIFYYKANFTQTMCDVLPLAINETENQSKCDDHLADTSLFEDIGYGVVSIVSYLFVGMFLSSTHRKLILMCLLGLAGVCGLTLIQLTNSTLIVLFFSFFLVFADIGSTTLLGYMFDLVPTHLCAQAACLATTVGRIGASMATYFIGVHLQMHCIGAFMIFSQLMLICALFAHFLQTKEKVNKMVEILK